MNENHFGAVQIIQNTVSISAGPKQKESTAHLLNIFDDKSSRRDELEKFIGRRFAEEHQTALCDFLPNLLSLSLREEIIAALGFSFASQKKLFLENYLEQPVELVLSKRLGKEVARKSCVEVGNLAASQSGITIALFIILVCAMANNGFEYLVFTAGSSLRKKFHRIGLEIEMLGKAHENLIKNSSRSDWGSYYENDPAVIYCKLQQALTLIEQNNIFKWHSQKYVKDINKLNEYISRKEIL